jgi:hypothetical protein
MVYLWTRYDKKKEQTVNGRSLPEALGGLLGILLLTTLWVALGDAAPPERVRLRLPLRSIPDTTPTYTWDAVAGATAYQLWVNDRTGNRLKRWYRAAALGCVAGTGRCQITPDVPLADGPGRWRVRARNAEGNGLWSAFRRFTVLPPTGSVQNVLEPGDRYDYVTDLVMAQPLLQEIWSILHESNAPCWISRNNTLHQYQFYLDASFLPGPLYRYSGFDVSVGSVVVHDLGWYFHPGTAQSYRTIHIDAAFDNIYLIIVDNRTMVEVFQHFGGSVVITPYEASSNNCL